MPSSGSPGERVDVMSESMIARRIARLGNAKMSRVVIGGNPDFDALFFEPEVPQPIVLLLSHGGGSDRLHGLWFLIEKLIAAGYPVVTAHLSGHGRSDGQDFFEVADVRHRLKAFVAWARERFSHSRVYLLGQSMGAAFTLDALLGSTPVDGAISVSAPLDLNIQWTVLKELSILASPEGLRSLRYVSPYEALPAIFAFRRKRFPIRTRSTEPSVKIFQNILRDLDLETRLAQAQLLPETLIIHGALDPVVPASHALRISNALLKQGTSTELQLLKKSRHFDILLNPETVSGILNWLQQRTLVKPSRARSAPRDNPKSEA